MVSSSNKPQYLLIDVAMVLSSFCKAVHVVKNPNWQEANQLAIYKRDQGVELHVGSTKKQLQLSVQSWT